MEPSYSIKSKENLEKRPKEFKTPVLATELLLIEAVEYWLSLYKHRQFSADTRKNYKATMKLFLKILPDDIRFVTDLRSNHIENFLDELLRKDYAIASINHYLKVVKVFYRWAEKRYKIPSPAKGIAGVALGVVLPLSLIVDWRIVFFMQISYYY